MLISLQHLRIYFQNSVMWYEKWWPTEAITFDSQVSYLLIRGSKGHSLRPEGMKFEAKVRAQKTRLVAVLRCEPSRPWGYKEGLLGPGTTKLSCLTEQHDDIPADNDDSLSHNADALAFSCCGSRTCFIDIRLALLVVVDAAWSIDECREWPRLWLAATFSSL